MQKNETSRLGSGEKPRTAQIRRVLVVDDDPAVRGALVRFLAGRHFEVEAAASGAEGLEVFEQRGADAVVLDVKMPDMDGFEVCKALRSTSDVPIIMLTGATNQMVRECLPLMVDGSGANAYLRKPLDVAAVAELLRGLETSECRHVQAR